MSVNERTIKVLHCNNDNYNLGGAFIITYRVNELLLKKGIVCDYITMDHFVDSCNFSIPEGVKTFSANLRKNRFLGHIILPFYVYSISLGDTIVCDELVKAIEGVTTNGKTKLQQG